MRHCYKIELYYWCSDRKKTRRLCWISIKMEIILKTVFFLSYFAVGGGGNLQSSLKTLVQNWNAVRHLAVKIQREMIKIRDEPTSERFFFFSAKVYRELRWIRHELCPFKSVLRDRRRSIDFSIAVDAVSFPNFAFSTSTRYRRDARTNQIRYLFYFRSDIVWRIGFFFFGNRSFRQSFFFVKTVVRT